MMDWGWKRRMLLVTHSNSSENNDYNNFKKVRIVNSN